MFLYIFKRLILMVMSIIFVLAFTYMILSFAMYVKWTHLSNQEIFIRVWQEFKVYFMNIVNHWDFGTSSRGEDVWELIGFKLLITMKYNITALLVYVPVGIFLGVLAAIKKNKLTDRIISVFSMISNSIPSFIIIALLVIYVGYKWQLLVPQEPAYSEPFLKQLEGLIIPVTALSIGPIGKFAQMVRGEIVENLNSDHFILLRTKGLTRKQAIIRHSLKDSLVTVIPEIIPTFVFVLGISFVIESLYNISGVSHLFLDSIVVQTDWFSTIIIDVNVVVAIGIILYGIIMVTSLFSDIFLTIIDPRIRITGKKRS